MKEISPNKTTIKSSCLISSLKRRYSEKPSAKGLMHRTFQHAHDYENNNIHDKNNSVSTG